MAHMTIERSRVLRALGVADERIAIGDAPALARVAPSVTTDTLNVEVASLRAQVREASATYASQQSTLTRLQAELDEARAALQQLRAAEADVMERAREQGHREGCARAEAELKREI